MKSKRLLVAVLAAAVMLVAGGMKASANPTASGTVLTNFATMTASNVGSSTQSNTINVTVKGIFGIATLTEPTDNTVLSGGFRDYQIGFVNAGNDTELANTIKINVGPFAFGAGAGTTTNWDIQADDAGPFVTGLNWTTSGNASASHAGDSAWYASSLAPGAVATFTLRIYAAPDASDGSTMSATMSIQTISTPAGMYTGLNGVGYGGLALRNRTAGALTAAQLTSTVQGPVLTLAKSFVITAPGGYTGAGTDPVPGASIEYTITYGNTGAAAATNVAIYDPIPANTAFEVNGYAVGYGIKLNGTNQTNSVDGDPCDFNGGLGRVECNIASLGSGSTGNTVKYLVTIN